MKKLVKLILMCLAVAVSFLYFTPSALAQARISTNIPGLAPASDICGFVSNFYTFSLMIAGILAFGAIVYGGVKYTLAAGNPSGQSEGKEWIKGALLGLLLLVGAYIILNTINPDIVRSGTSCLPSLPAVSLPPPPPPPPGGGGEPHTVCRLGTRNLSVSTGRVYPSLQECAPHANTSQGEFCMPGSFPTPQQPCTVTGLNCTPTTGTLGTCGGAGCSPSPALSTAIGCINSSQAVGTITATTGGQHRCVISPPSVSCHFGGRSCNDGGHSFDLGKNALASKNLTLIQGFSIAQGCGGTCYYETANGAQRFSAYNPAADHVHCNVAASSCSCN